MNFRIKAFDGYLPRWPDKREIRIVSLDGDNVVPEDAPDGRQ